MLAAPRRLAAARTLSAAAYRALLLAVVLLAGATLFGRLPRLQPTEAGVWVVLAGFAFLVQARFAGWVQDLGLALGCTLGCHAVVLALCGAALVGQAGWHGWEVCTLAWACCAAAANAGLAVHAVHRYWFSCPAASG
jgi:hypothetical protein